MVKSSLYYLFFFGFWNKKIKPIRQINYISYIRQMVLYIWVLENFSESQLFWFKSKQKKWKKIYFIFCLSFSYIFSSILKFKYWSFSFKCLHHSQTLPTTHIIIFFSSLILSQTCFYCLMGFFATNQDK